MLEEAYVSGFVRRCQERGFDPTAVVKQAQFDDAQAENMAPEQPAAPAQTIPAAAIGAALDQVIARRRMQGK